jgi:dipeptidyl aminopeptidase/acylaminoacyl peptidase
MATKLSVLPLFGDRQVIPVPAGVQAANGRFSPDGRWLAYQSSDSGSPEVWLQPFPPTGAKWQISHEGGSWPRWRPDGKELYFVTRDRTLVGAAIEVGRDLRAGASKRLFPVRYGGLTAQYPYDVSADGQRFLVISPPADENTTSVTILSNWRPTI